MPAIIIPAIFAIMLMAGHGAERVVFHGRPVPHQCRGFDESQKPMNKGYCDMWTAWAQQPAPTPHRGTRQ